MGMGFYGEVTRRTIADTRTDLGIASIASGTNISNGTYTPTLSSFVNCSPAVSGLFTWSRSGNVVTVAGNVTLSATALGLFQFRISLPVASNFTANNDSAGNITGTEGYGVVFSNPTVDTAEALCRAKDSIATSTYTVVFQYQVK